MQKNTLAAIIFAFALFLVFVLVLPQYDAIKAAKEAVNSRQLFLNGKTALLDNIFELDRQAGLRQADISKIKAFLPERKQIDELVSSIHKIMEQSGMQLSGLTTSEALFVGESEYKKIFIGADIVGTYPAFINFLKLAEQSLRLYDIFDITAVSSTISLGNINFGIKMNAYYLK
ncbi:MAG: type 4a pilus biogenesis protein PilO [Candidatus Yanofskybacteria bacterium]|nr:type 4a pilus biogenesis protein PilO [Candidatus Yanofskybacteria bacterium]